MGIKQKLMMLSIMAGIVVLLISTLGYFQAYKGLREGAKHELMIVVGEQAEIFNGWLREKQRIAMDEANLMTALADRADIRHLQGSISLYKGDTDVVNVAYGDETGVFFSSRVGIHQGIDVHTRDWYQRLMKDRKPSFTDPYESLSTKELVVSAIAPFEDGNGEFAGGICVDIGLDTLLKQVREMKRFGAGTGYLFDADGKMIVSAGEEHPARTDLKDIEHFAAHGEEILSKEKGVFEIRGNEVIAFSRIPTTGWIVCLAVPEKAVFAQLSDLRIVYGLLTLFGLIIVAVIFFLCTRFAEDIVNSVSAIERHAHEIAKGNLALEDLEVASQDEIGSLTESFNTMRHDLRALVQKMSGASGDVATASRNLVKHVELTAQAAEHISKLAGKVNRAMVQQLEDVETMATNVDTAFADMDELSAKAQQMVESVAASAEALALLRQDVGMVLASLGTSEERQGIETVDSCFTGLLEEYSGIQQRAEELHNLAQSVAEKTGYIIDTVGSIDRISRKTSQSAGTIEASTEEQESSILEIVAAAQSLEDLATDMHDAVVRFRL